MEKGSNMLHICSLIKYQICSIHDFLKHRICSIYTPPYPFNKIYLPIGSLIQNPTHHYTRRVGLKASSPNPEHHPLLGVNIYV